jgi:multiple sugar transport system permease protein
MATVTTTMVRPRHRLSPVRRRDLFDGLLFASPLILGVLFFWIGPMLYSFWLVTHDWDLISPPKYTGLRNLERLMHDPLVGKSLFNTAYYTFLGVPLQLLVAFVLALMLNQAIRGRSIYRTIYYLPAITPAVASAVVWTQILNPEFGVLNNVLSWFGIGPIKWLFDPTYARPALILMSLWFVGPQMVVFLAGLQGVPQTLLDAAAIDGANALRRFRHVTVPIVSPVIFFNLIIGIIGSFQVFTSAFVMTNGGPRDSTLFIVLYIYRNAFQYFRMGYAAALAWLLFVIIMIFTAIQFRFANRWVHYGN